ncbi:MAG: molybdopterin-dependent oxidoreductase [Thermoanaerobaculia bacterium]
MATHLHRTVCNRDCPDACGLVVTLEEGKVVRVGGDPDHPVTLGFICSRTSQFPARQNDPGRITTPLKRTGADFVPVPWEEALGEIAERLLAIRAESGPAAILHYRSGGSLGLLKYVVDLFWESFGPVAVKRGDICSGAGDAAQETDFGHEDSHDLFDLKNSKNILLWGKNPNVSNIHLLPLLQEAKKRGTRILLVDPVRHKGEKLADRTILVRPGGDFDLAMGAAALLFAREETDPDAPSYCDDFEKFRALALSRSPGAWARAADVSLEDVGAVASALAGTPCSIQVGWGMGRRTNGSAIVRALDALCGVSGNIGIAGGGVSFYFRRRGAFDTSFLKKNPPRTLCEPILGKEILEAHDPAVRAVWVTAGNPVAMLPDSATVARALESRELVVVVDSFLTDTAHRAHFVLPTTTLVEDDDLFGAYGHHWLGASTPALAPPGEVFSDLEIVQALARAIDARTGSSEEKTSSKVKGTAREWKERMLVKAESLGITAARLERESVRNPFAEKVLFADRKFKTSSGKMNLVHEMPPEPPEEAGFPLWLFSNSTEKSQSSQWAGKPPEILTAICHPDAANGFGDGEVVSLESALGGLRARLVFDASQRRDVVIVPKGGHFDSGTSANALIRARLTDAGEGAAYQDCRVRIVPANSSNL